MDLHKYVKLLQDELFYELQKIDNIGIVKSVYVECINYPIFELQIYTKTDGKYNGYLMRFISQSDISEDLSYIYWFITNKQNKNLYDIKGV